MLRNSHFKPTASIVAEASLFKLIFFVCATREDVCSLMLTLFLTDRKKCNVKNTLNHHSMNKEDILKYSEKPVNLLLSLKTLKKYGVFKRNSSWNFKYLCYSLQKSVICILRVHRIRTVQFNCIDIYVKWCRVVMSEVSDTKCFTSLPSLILIFLTFYQFHSLCILSFISLLLSSTFRFYCSL